MAVDYDFVVVCCVDNKFMNALQTKVQESFEEPARKKIIIGEPENLFALLDHYTIQQATTETKLKGYRVKVEYDALSQEERKRKQHSVAKIILESLRKMKK